MNVLASRARCGISQCRRVNQERHSVAPSQGDAVRGESRAMSSKAQWLYLKQMPHVHKQILYCCWHAAKLLTLSLAKRRMSEKKRNLSVCLHIKYSSYFTVFLESLIL